MVANPERRAQLADAGLSILASAGARGLTHRAVDRHARVPPGTSINYFRSRDDLLSALGDRILERLAPAPERMAELSGKPPSLELMIEFLLDIHERTTRAPELMIALFELRLEAARHPHLKLKLGSTLSQSYREDVKLTEQLGLPGGAFEVALLHYAIEGFLFDQVTTQVDPDIDSASVIRALAYRLLAPFQLHAFS